MSDGEEFFIGWQGKAPEKTGRFLRAQAVRLTIAAVLLAGVLALMQGTIGKAFFEFGTVKEFGGVLVADPVPILIAEQPDEVSGARLYYLVNPLKHGFDEDVAMEMNGKGVRLMGTLIYRDDGGPDLGMIEVAPGSVEVIAAEADGSLAREARDLGDVVLRGEIVDSKCYLGVMNPGNLKPHRACAVNCIRGGIPPVLLVRRAEGGARYLVLIGPEGEPVNEVVLPYVALPVEVKGQAEAWGEIEVLRIDPDDIRVL